MYPPTTKACLFLFPLLFTTILSAQQVLFLDDEATSIVLSGTSTLHDWEMPLQHGHISGSATFAFSDDGLTKLTGLEVSIEAEGLKSNRKGMNNDAYDALNTKKFPYITFQFAELKRMEKQTNGYLIEVTGDLTISGLTKTVDLQATCTLNGRQKAICDGTYSLNMVDYGVEPPRTMLGLVKAGEEVTVVYHAVFVP